MLCDVPLKHLSCLSYGIVLASSSGDRLNPSIHYPLGCHGRGPDVPLLSKVRPGSPGFASIFLFWRQWLNLQSKNSQRLRLIGLTCLLAYPSDRLVLAHGPLVSSLDPACTVVPILTTSPSPCQSTGFIFVIYEIHGTILTLYFLINFRAQRSNDVHIYIYIYIYIHISSYSKFR